MTVYAARHAWVEQQVRADVRIRVAGGRIADLEDGPAQDGDVPLPGLVLPGLANTHSHAFHRALRGRTGVDGAGGGSFWTWREAMYAVANRLTPDTYRRLARAVYAEMVLAGITCVGEFHYLHDRSNAMGDALVAAAADAGLRITLLDACYLAGGIGEPLRPEQRRFSDGTAADWAARVAELRPSAHARIGVAVHSVRAVPFDDIPAVVAAADGRPLHVHLSEQPAENDACLRAYGLTPAALLARAGALGATTTAVHATRVSDADIGLLGDAGVTISVCPTTERDLADGIGPARRLFDAGCPLTLGSDQHVVIDPFEEARALEMHERLVTGRRGHFTTAELTAALTGHASLGWPDAGALVPGARADLVAVRLDTVRTAGAAPEAALLAAGAADVDTVVVDGQVVVRAGRHRLGDIGGLLTQAVGAVTHR